MFGVHMGFSETVKKHALSAAGNECSAPGCSALIFDPQERTLLGQVAHIKGNRPGSARYDPNQTEEERQSYANAIVLCGTHHLIVDNLDNVHRYPVDVLRHWKTKHEADVAGRRAGSWLRPPNSITRLENGEPLVIHYWVDAKGHPQLYDDKQFAQSEAALQLSLRLSELTDFLRMVEASTVPEPNASDGGQLAYLKSQATKLTSSPEALYKDLVELITILEDVTFGEFIAAIIQPRHERADYERQREDVARRAEAKQRERATKPRHVNWRGNRGSA